MALEAEVVGVSKPGTNVDILVAYRDRGAEVGRETLSFSHEAVLDEASLRFRINVVGSRFTKATASEAFARSVVGTVYPVDVVILPNPTLPVI